MTTDTERIAVLEIKVMHLEDSLDSLTKSQDAMLKAQQDMLLALTKYRGMWGGIALLFGGIWAFLTTFGKDIAAFFHR